MALLSPKDPAEVITLRFDFCSMAPFGSSISSAQVGLLIHAGDPGQDTTGLLPGQPSIDGAVVTQKMTGGTLGSIYRIKCVATFDTGEKFALSGDVPVNTVFGV